MYADLNATWFTAKQFKQNLDNGRGFLSSIPQYERFLLPSIIVGYYYHLIDKEIYEEKEDGQIVIKKQNSKFGLIFFQILIYFTSLIFSQKS